MPSGAFVEDPLVLLRRLARGSLRVLDTLTLSSPHRQRNHRSQLNACSPRMTGKKLAVLNERVALQDVETNRPGGQETDLFTTVTP